jgi:hypothetical protein
MPRQVFEDGPALKADHAVFLNGLAKVGTVVASSLANTDWRFYTILRRVGKGTRISGQNPLAPNPAGRNLVSRVVE